MTLSEPELAVPPSPGECADARYVRAVGPGLACDYGDTGPQSSALFSQTVSHPSG